QVLRSAIQMRGCEKIDTVIPPAEVSWKIRDRHHFNNSDPYAGQLRQLFCGGAPAPFGGKSANVHLINDLALQLLAGPFRVRPAKRCRIDYLGRTMRSIGLKTRRWIGMKMFGVINTEPIAVARAGLGRPGKIPAFFPSERMKCAVRIFRCAFFKHYIDACRFWRPNAKMRLVCAH